MTENTSTVHERERKSSSSVRKPGKVTKLLVQMQMVKEVLGQELFSMP
jgi:hypothetical protein